MDITLEVRQLKNTLSMFVSTLSTMLHDALIFFLNYEASRYSHELEKYPFEKWEFFEHFIRNVLKRTTAGYLKPKISEDIRWITPSSEPMLIKKTDLKIQVDGMETIYCLIPYKLLCKFIVVCEAKYRKNYSKQLAHELMTFVSKADYVLYQESIKLLSHLHKAQLFCGVKYVVTSCNLPKGLQEWLLTCGVLPISPNSMIIKNLGDTIDHWKFVLFMSNFNRLIGKTNMFVPLQWQVQHLDVFFSMSTNFVRLLRDKKHLLIERPIQKQLFEKILRMTILNLKRRQMSRRTANF